MISLLVSTDQQALRGRWLELGQSILPHKKRSHVHSAVSRRLHAKHNVRGYDIRLQRPKSYVSRVPDAQRTDQATAQGRAAGRHISHMDINVIANNRSRALGTYLSPRTCVARLRPYSLSRRTRPLQPCCGLPITWR